MSNLTGELVGPNVSVSVCMGLSHSDSGLGSGSNLLEIQSKEA